MELPSLLPPTRSSKAVFAPIPTKTEGFWVLFKPFTLCTYHIGGVSEHGQMGPPTFAVFFAFHPSPSRFGNLVALVPQKLPRLGAQLAAPMAWRGDGAVRHPNKCSRSRSNQPRGSGEGALSPPKFFLPAFPTHPPQGGHSGVSMVKVERCLLLPEAHRRWR